MDSSKAEKVANLIVKVADKSTLVPAEKKAPEKLELNQDFKKLIDELKETNEETVRRKDISIGVALTPNVKKSSAKEIVESSKVHLYIRWNIDEHRTLEYLFDFERYEPKSKVESMITTLENWKVDLHEKLDGIENTNPLRFTIDPSDSPFTLVVYRDLLNRKIETSDSFFSETPYEGILSLLEEALKYL